MNKGLGFLILGILAILGGAAFAALVVKNKIMGNNEIDFDDYDAVEDEELEHFLNDADDNNLSEEKE